MHAFKTFLVGLILLAWSLPALADEPPGPRQVVERVTQEVLDLLDEQADELLEDRVALYEAIEPIVGPHVAVERVAEQILGPHWRRADPELQERFLVAFERSLVRTYGSTIGEYRGLDVRVLGVRRDPNRDNVAQVGMDIRTGSGSPARVLYEMERQEDGHWRLINLTAEGISLVQNYREDFRSRLRERSLEEEVERMERRNADAGLQ
ncbi:phospholipid transport system substrate-binding protein [Alkalispirillum mobile]|uniref:Phospholipid transport system substrate-binding protein n=1 Tax=Alkalispirillum mobile TaxID=85925 RepID=A0A498BT82_9GAMM|nr:ABC transporter substrate-binding protein [Alkalispirillum mobile]RLK46885.1 phospholipid transport system substrate-binding protein [Alkalispirillum mobile]